MISLIQIRYSSQALLLVFTCAEPETPLMFTQVPLPRYIPLSKKDGPLVWIAATRITPATKKKE